MLFGKKSRSEELPDLPPSVLLKANKEMLPPPVEEEERALPAFPDSPIHNKFSQAAIKDAVGEPDGELPESSEEEIEEEENLTETEEWSPSDMQTKSEFPVSRSNSENFELKNVYPTRKIFGQERQRRMLEETPTVARASDVFVKIDKYHMARKSLNDIAEKLIEIDSLIKRIRETKLREEQELAVWERDVAHIKSRIHDVTENIFEKVD